MFRHFTVSSAKHDTRDVVEVLAVETPDRANKEWEDPREEDSLDEWSMVSSEVQRGKEWTWSWLICLV